MVHGVGWFTVLGGSRCWVVHGVGWFTVLGGSRCWVVHGVGWFMVLGGSWCWVVHTLFALVCAERRVVVCVLYTSVTGCLVGGRHPKEREGLPVVLLVSYHTYYNIIMFLCLCYRYGGML